MTDYSIEQCELKAARFREANPSTRTYQKFTCSHCGTRLTVDKPDVWFETGTCDQCGRLTNIRDRGCGFVLTFDVRRR